MKWINVKDGLPQKGQEILVYVKLDDILSFKGIDKYECTLNPSITHWMPITDPESYEMD